MVARSWMKGVFVPQNPEKYKSLHPPVFRSSWEKEFMIYCDQHPDVLEWISEPDNFGSGRRGIPYHNPIKGRQSVYIPDFLITQKKKNGQIVKKMIEIKPMAQADENYASTTADGLALAVNQAKWGAATAWCMRHNVEFIVLTESQMFQGGSNKVMVNPRIKSQIQKRVAKAVKNNTMSSVVVNTKSKNTIRGRAGKTSTSRVSRVRKV